MARTSQRRPDGGAAANPEIDQDLNTAARPENQAPPRPSLVEEIDRILDGRWPARLRVLFDPLDPRPLAIGVTREIVAELQLDRQTARTLRRRLGQWCGRPSYLEALIRPGALRYDLSGQPTGPVSPEHREAAREQLERWRQKWRARKAALRSACQANARLPTLRLGGHLARAVR